MKVVAFERSPVSGRCYYHHLVSVLEQLVKVIESALETSGHSVLLLQIFSIYGWTLCAPLKPTSKQVIKVKEKQKPMYAILLKRNGTHHRVNFRSSRKEIWNPAVTTPSWIAHSEASLTESSKILVHSISLGSFSYLRFSESVFLVQIHMISWHCVISFSRGAKHDIVYFYMDLGIPIWWCHGNNYVRFHQFPFAKWIRTSKSSKLSRSARAKRK